MTRQMDREINPVKEVKHLREKNGVNKQNLCEKTKAVLKKGVKLQNSSKDTAVK